MEDKQLREEFDTGLKKIGLEIRSRLVPHGLFGSITNADSDTGDVPAGSRIQIVAKGRSAARSFDRAQIEGCCLRVSGPVLVEIISMIDEVSA